MKVQCLLKMTNKKCRACGAEFFDKPLLIYENSPESAQNFIEDLSSTKDAPVKLEIYQCSKCGLIQHNLKPVSYYKKVIRAVSFSNEMTTFRLNQLDTWLEKYRLKNKSILEVGSGKGEYLNIFKQLVLFSNKMNPENYEMAKTMFIEGYEGYETIEDIGEFISRIIIPYFKLFACDLEELVNIIKTKTDSPNEVLGYLEVIFN